MTFTGENDSQILGILLCLVQDSVGFNLAAMKFIKQHLEDNEQVRFFSDLTLKHKEKSKKANRVTLVTLKSAASL